MAEARKHAEPAEGARGVRPRGVYLVEHYLPDLDDRRVDVLTGRLRAAAELERGAGGVRLLGSAGLPGDDSFLSIFEASSVEAVARTIERAEIAADRIVPALWRTEDR
jgi:hypothetical protein